MKKFALNITAFAFAFAASAQVTSVPSENIDPSDSVKIIVNLDELDVTQTHVQNLIADADAGLDVYIWTWKPAEHAAGHPLVNGLGGAPWKNSNPALVMKKEANHIYSYTMLPIDWYEVDAATVYKEDIHFLIKPQDGGGYGDPDRKSGDLVLKIDPPATERDPVYAFPAKLAEDDLVTIVYDNWRETKPSMKNLDADSAYIHAECKLLDGSVIKYPTNYFLNPADFPNAKMELVDDGVFNFIFVPEEYFNLDAGDEIDEIKIVIRKPVFTGGNERVADDLIVVIKCP